MSNSTNSPASPQLKPGIYRHYKGKRYLVLMVGRLESNLEPHVVYIPLYEELQTPSHIWIRALDDFTASVTIQGVIRPRFKYVGPAI